MDSRECARVQDTLRSHPEWADELVAESAGVTEEDVSAVRAAVLGQAEEAG